MTGFTGPIARRGHPRLVILLSIGAIGLIVGLGLWLTAGPLGHRLGTAGFRIATGGILVLAFAASGLLAFAVFGRGFG